MRKFVLSVLVSIIMAIGLVSARPLVINADSLSIYYDNTTLQSEWQGKIVGDYWPYTSTDYTNTAEHPIYKYKLRFDQAYIGQVQFNVRYENENWSGLRTRCLVAGYESFDMYIQALWTNNTLEQVYAIKIVAVDLTPLDDFGGDLASIISYLQSIDATEDDIYNVLQSISSDTETLTKMRQWNIFFESYSAMAYSMKNYVPYDVYGTEYWNYPIYKYSVGNIITSAHFRPSENNYLILMINKNIYNATSFNNYLEFETNVSGATVSIVKVEQLQVFTDPISNTLIKVTLSCDTNNYVSIKPKYEVYAIPIYFNKVSVPVSTDFALLFGLSNQLLDDLHIVAQGTQQSNSSSSDLEDSAQEYGELADDVLGLEDDLGSGFSSSLNNVPTSFNFSTQFGNKFLHSATWVRTQFETLTTNTPFGTLITFSLVLGLALLLVGRRLL